MRHIKNFLHNINDVVLAIVIVALAAGIIYWRLQIILDYPKQLAEQQAVYNEEKAKEAEADAEAAAAEEAAQEEADRIHMALDYVEGGIHLLEKLVAGEWNEQFLVAEKGHLIRHGDFFE